MGVFRQKINFLETKENKIPMDRLLKVYKILPKVMRKLDQMIVEIKNTVLNLTFFNYNKKPIYKKYSSQNTTDEYSFIYQVMASS